ncbi:MAG: hypothetical protein JWM90_1757 [Thermoleophilia bacterium]|nr:hypothetical protein [Thermoleophilia bacterium]
MSPVHVIVGDDARAEAMWAEAFAGVVDLYRFDRNVEAFERLTAAEAPVDLVVLTPAQSGPFNLTPDQFVSRILESSALSTSRHLANLHVVVVGQPLTRQHPRAIQVATLDAAIRLVKYGEVRQAPQTAPVAVAPIEAPMPPAGGMFSDGVISRIWDAADAADRAERAVLGGGAAAPAAPVAPVAPVVQAAAAPTPAAPVAPQRQQLFERAASEGFVLAPEAQVMGGGAARPQQVGAPGESIEVASGMLQSSRPYALPNGAGYRGPQVRQGQVSASSHHAMSIGAPVPPALQAQVQQVVYGGQPGAAPDPILVWSSSARSQVVSATVPVPTSVAPQPPQQQVAAQMQQLAPMQAPAPMQAAPVRVVPMEPPAGVYGGAPQQPTQQVAPQPALQNPNFSADPMLARVEREHAAVSFG